MALIDITVETSQSTFRYRESWGNKISTISSTKNRDNSTVHRLDLCSHSCTYIETSRHKLDNNINLDDIKLDRFHTEVLVFHLPPDDKNCITLENFKKVCSVSEIDIKKGCSILINSGWTFESANHANYLSGAPYFENELTTYLASLELNILAVDTPIIDNQKKPYNAVAGLFDSSPSTLLLAPISLDKSVKFNRKVLLTCFPLKIKNICASPCRAVIHS
ncbi:hypothetical protein tloyanaT_29140 [Thalassotalea loyana]|uniref:Cyclase family protein n=1 Tax=Thalassotalea loyana TaxID=280483 RepID=A0ABQ6HIY8_9GAMM|nr:cyclase family protein [Thalassotalea loyana]GLX86661.1 hypothetical protein tloyanaT_29140 [Thalassotalea loyana]